MSGRGRGEGARRGPPPPLGRFAGRPQKACVYNMKKLLSTFPSTFKKKKKTALAASRRSRCEEVADV